MFYRSFVQRAARLLGLFGYAKNLETGDVEIVVSGQQEAVNELVTRCYEGPSGAQVDDVQIMWRPVTEDFKRFEIR